MLKRALFIILLIAAMTVILVQCAPAPTEAPAATSESAPTEAPAQAEPTQAPVQVEPTQAPAQAEPTQASEEDASAPAALDGKTLVETRCTGCHSLDKVTSAKKSYDGWKSNVERMVGKGAQLNAEEQLAVIQYLAETYK